MIHHQACLICLNDNVRSIDSQLRGSVTSDFRYLDFVLQYWLCDNCGYIYRTRDARIDRSTYYTNEYDLQLEAEEIERVIYEEGEARYSDYLISLLAEFITDAKGKSCLDIGAGKGNFVSSLHKSYPDLAISAVEPSKSYNVLKEKIFLKSCHKKFFAAQDFKGSHFDYVILTEVLEHVLNPKEFLEDIKKVMKNESLLILSVPNVENDRYDFLSHDHISRFTPGSIMNLFRVAGIKIIKSYIPQKSASMIFIVQLCSFQPIIKSSSGEAIRAASNLIENAINDAKKIGNTKLAMYGQGLIIHYLLEQGILSSHNIVCIIDDNISYQGKKWKQAIDIMSLNDFFGRHKDVDHIFLAMNECYHEQVIAKFPPHFKVFGTVQWHDV